MPPANFAELDALSSQELHDRAWHHAEHHANLKFFWDLLELIPVAEAAEGKVGQADSDIQHPGGQILDALHEDASLLEALRPVYLDYLTKHPDA